MNNSIYKSEIRDSTIENLLEKVQKSNYSNYLMSIRLEKIRLFRETQINFDFPVTALIGSNGSGKSTILGASACIYTSVVPHKIFPKCRIGDEDMDDWRLIYGVIDKVANPRDVFQASLTFSKNSWLRTHNLLRYVKIFGITRTVPAHQNSLFALKKKLSVHGHPRGTLSISTRKVENVEHIRCEAERILGKSFSDFQLIEVMYAVKKRRQQKRKIESKQILEDGRESIIRSVKPAEKVSTYTQKQYLYLCNNGVSEYSEFNFGSGEASVIRMVADIEALPSASLILIDEIENGLHPLAVCKLVEYLIDVARRKNVQVIFTTHSDYALNPLPPEAIWASIDGELQQGKLSVETLRSVSGYVDKRLAIFVEDEFAKFWIEAILREKLGYRLEEVGIYPVYGDSNVIKTHLGHISNPAIVSHSICFVDGDSKYEEDVERRIFRLPGLVPESTVFNSVVENLDHNITSLTLACQRSLDKQQMITKVIREASRSNRDPHLLFSQIGANINNVPETIVRGAFLTIWVQEHPAEVNRIVKHVELALEIPLE